MITQNIQIKIDEVQDQLSRIRQAPKSDPEKRRAVIKEVVGDAEEYLANLLVFLRNL